MPRLSMLIDLTRCIGCDACTLACKQENGTPFDTFFARVLNVEVGTYPDVKRLYIPVLCNHCDDAPCLKSCPNKAIIRRPDGIVLVDQDRCRGTGACVSACPYGNIILNREPDSWYLDEDEPYEKDFVKARLKPNVARKCTYCAHRVDQGLKPACVVACPTTARIFGDLEDEASDISQYVAQERETTQRKPFHLLEEAGTKPAGCYLGPMSKQDPHTLHQTDAIGDAKTAEMARVPQQGAKK
ncbi:MAG: 4Fe-4S dicluster domain-containing protein [Armatimonadetes bacterium]|nr:4Fe-4S dicluster domain-containing protein [Armatimonadota bacterium]